MTILEQSSKALDRTLGAWFSRVENGSIKLPRFQRMEAWDRSRITSFLNTIIHNLPVGAALILEVGDDQKFVSRYVSTADPDKPERVTEHLLDGQQRITAFWRAIHNNYDTETFFVYLPDFDRTEDDGIEEDEVVAYCLPRWINKEGKRYPLWANEPEQCLRRGLIPLELLRPGDHAVVIEEWLNKAKKSEEPKDSDSDFAQKYRAHEAQRRNITAQLTKLRERITHFNLPYLSLPARTPKDVALQVFINMNTNSKPLKLYDIAVAEIEQAVGKSLHDLQDHLDQTYPAVKRYGDLDSLVLQTGALMQDKTPNNQGIVSMDKTTFVANWTRLENAMARMASLLSLQGVYDEARLPTNAVLAVVGSCYDLIPEDGDFLGQAERLLRAYVWSSFFTDRYENSAATRAYQDYKALRTLLEEKKCQPDQFSRVPVLDRSAYPLLTAEQMLQVGWPKNSDRYGRAILAVTMRLGAIDFADGQIGSYDNIQKREYHHIFPDALLAEAEIESYLALNCALITWKTNRHIGRKDPVDYLRDRVQWSDEQTIAERLKSHLIDYAELTKAHYGELKGEALAAKLKSEFTSFLSSRAAKVTKAMARLANGDQPLPIES
jgi:hypothetical protein